MSRNTRQHSNVTGPTSALTGFLAAHNISANDIRRTANTRRAAAAAQAQTQPETATETTDTADANPNPNDDAEAEENSERIVVTTATTRARRTRETKAQLAKRKAEEKKAIEKIKAGKKRKHPGDDSEDSEDSEDSLADPSKRKPRPGQLSNCELCGKRFTVTAYTRGAPDGGNGLLCSECGVAVGKGQKPQNKKARQTGGVGIRRTMQSRILDGTFRLGAKPLVTLCVEMLAKNVDLADDLGDLPDHQVDRIARLVSKRRLLNPRTLQLFVRPSTERLCVYDAAHLGVDDFTSSFAVMQNLKHIKIRNGIQFKDQVMEYLVDRNVALKSIYMHGANLLSDDAWTKYLLKRGESLQALRIYFTDKHIGDAMIPLLQKHCPDLAQLKLYHNQKLTDAGVKAIAGLKLLRHLGLRMLNKATSETYVSVINALGPTLETLSLRVVPDTTDDVLAAIHTSCRALSKLQITDSELMTDKGFADLFTNWPNPPLRTINFEKCRHVDELVPVANPDTVGLCSDGFRALMAHSGAHLECLNVHACRHISTAAFEDVFRIDPAKGTAAVTYPCLRDIEISFCEHVTPLVVQSIFRCCPALRRLNVFGCMNVKDKGMKVPPTVNMVGGADAYGLRFDA